MAAVNGKAGKQDHWSGCRRAAFGSSAPGDDRAHSQTHNNIMSISLGLVLPARGKQRELYKQLKSRLETGSATERQQVLQSLQSLHYPVAVH